MTPEILCDEIAYRLYDMESGKFILNKDTFKINDNYIITYNRTEVNVSHVFDSVFNIKCDFNIDVMLDSELLISFYIDSTNKKCVIHNLLYVIDNRLKLMIFLSVLESKRKELFYGNTN